MQRYTLLFTDAIGKTSVLNFRDKKLTVQERMKEQVSTLKETLTNETTRVETLDADTSMSVYTVTVLHGWVYNSVQRVFYGTFQVVPLIDTVEPVEAPTETTTTEEPAKPKNAHAEVLLELSKKLKARRLANIPYAPPLPPLNRVYKPVQADREELVNRLAQRRRQIEGY